MLQGKKILLGITGSIAAYKAVHLVRQLIKEGATVKVIMTPAAADFVSPLTLATLSRNPVIKDLFNEQSWSNHVMLGRWADLFIIAPLSCNTLSKMAHGQCDNLLMAVYLSATCPVVVAPAMDEDMWHHSTTKQNIRIIQSAGNSVMPVGDGELASGLVGEGRMAEPEEIVTYIGKHFFKRGILTGKKALVTAGPTYEAIDPVRFIGNHSSGKMGVAIAQELQSRGAMVTLVHGPGRGDQEFEGIETVDVVSAAEMFDACDSRFDENDIIVMAAAVADYTPVQQAVEKIKKNEVSFPLELKRTTDILKTLGERKKKGQVLVGFALETNNEKEFALEKLVKKNADMIVLNSLRDPGAGFGHSTNKITIYHRSGAEQHFETKTKEAVAIDILDSIIANYYA